MPKRPFLPEKHADAKRLHPAGRRVAIETKKTPDGLDTAELAGCAYKVALE